VDGHIKEFKGTYAEWVEWNERMAAKNTTQKKEDKPKPAPAAKPPAVESKQPVTKEAKKELQKQQKLFQQYEERLATLKEEKKKLEASLASPEVYSDKNTYAQAEAEYKKVDAELAKVNKEYEQVFEKIVELENNAAQNT
jgi:ATP-binding cassette subfamily F protein 3